MSKRPMPPRYIAVPFAGTPGAAVVPVNTPGLSASVVNSTTINLFASFVSPPPAASYLFESAPSASGPFVPLASGPSSTTVASGLSPLTTYYFQVKVQVTDGRFSSYSPIVFKTTLGQVPATPTGISATGVSQTEIDVSWNAVSGATSYHIYRDGAALAFDTASPFQDTGLSPSTTHTYTVAAINATGEGSQGIGDPGTTLSPVIGGTATKFISGVGWWGDNQYWPGNQQGALNLHMSNWVKDDFTKIIMVALPAGSLETSRGNYTVGFNIIDGLLARIRGATFSDGVTPKKMGLIVKWWQTFFNDSSLTSTSDWSQYMVDNKWITAFFDPNSNQRTQLKWDIDDVWTAIQARDKAYGDRYNNDPNFLAWGVGDESEAVDTAFTASGQKGQFTVINGQNYNDKYLAHSLAIKPHWANTFVYIPYNFLPAGNSDETTQMTQHIRTQQAAFPGGYLYGGPDPATQHNIHGNTGGAWITTFQNLVTGRTGTLGNMAGSLPLISHTEGLGERNAAVTPTQIYDDAINIYKAQMYTITTADYNVWKYADQVATFQSRNNGKTAPLPPGNWIT